MTLDNLVDLYKHWDVVVLASHDQTAKVDSRAGLSSMGCLPKRARPPISPSQQQDGGLFLALSKRKKVDFAIITIAVLIGILAAILPALIAARKKQ